jgi:hypothetical protein
MARRKIVIIVMIVAFPLAAIAGAFGAIGGRSTSTSTGTVASSGPPGSDLMIAACQQIATLAQAATGGTATPSSMLSDMRQASQYADAAAQTDPVWQPMASNIAKLNTMVQSDTGDQASFTSQLDTVTQECGTVAATNGQPPASTG